MKRVIVGLVVAMVLGVASFSCAIEPVFFAGTGIHLGEATKEQVLKQVRKESPRSRIQCKRVDSSDVEICSVNDFIWRKSRLEVKFKSGRLAHTQSFIADLPRKDVDKIFDILKNVFKDPDEVTTEKRPMLNVITCRWYLEKYDTLIQFLTTEPHSGTIAISYTYLPLSEDQE